MHHCIAKIREIIASGRDDPRAILQIGYNLGRLSELTGLGRGPFWDAWKGPIEDWDRERLAALASELQACCSRLDDAPEVPSEVPPT